MANELITIVIPVYNRAGIVGRTLKSIETQSVRPLRVILVDNASTDGTMQVLTRWAEAVKDDGITATVSSEPKRGATAARNRGLAEVETPWVMFFDSDDEMLPDHVSGYVEAINANPGTDIFMRGVKIVNLDGSQSVKKARGGDPFFNHLFHSTLATQRGIVRTDIVRNAGGWYESIARWNDLEWGLRMMLHSRKTVNIKGKPSVNIHAQAESITGTDFSTCADALERSLDRCEKDVIVAGRLDLVRWIDARRAILAATYAREGATAESQRLLNTIAENNRAPRRLKLLYNQNRIMGRGTAILARLLL